MPKHFPALIGIKRHIRHRAIAFERTAQIPEFITIDLGNDNVGTEFLRRILKKLGGGGLPGFRWNGGGASIVQIEGDIDFGVRAILDLFKVLLP